LDKDNESFQGATAVAERREAARHSFSATAEVVEMTSGGRVSTRAADLSQKGCYLDTLNPFPTGTKVQVRIRWDDSEFTCAAEVRDSQAGMGMGVAFTDLDDAQRALIESWVARLVAPPVTAHSPAPHAEDAAPATSPGEQDVLAARLIDLLYRKGLLSSSDVAALLRERVI
jgi:hypothetical protein